MIIEVVLADTITSALLASIISTYYVEVWNQLAARLTQFYDQMYWLTP